MFADIIKTLRRSKGVSQQELATAIGLSQQAVNRWENHQAVPSADVVKKIVTYFGISSDYFLGTQGGRCGILSGDEIRLVEGYRQLNSKSKNLVKALINHLTEETAADESPTVIQSNYQNTGGTNVVNVNDKQG